MFVCVGKRERKSKYSGFFLFNSLFPESVPFSHLFAGQVDFWSFTKEKNIYDDRPQFYQLFKKTIKIFIRLGQIKDMNKIYQTEI